jgi:cytidine deaminase
MARKRSRPAANQHPAALVRLARAARKRAFARFSGFAVGAALRTTDGRIVTGCNVENATYGLTICAERVAVYKAVSEGLRRFDAVVVVADTEVPSPCGPCRQILWEFCGDIVVYMVGSKGRTTTARLSELLPLPFDSRSL